MMGTLVVLVAAVAVGAPAVSGPDVIAEHALARYSVSGVPEGASVAWMPPPSGVSAEMVGADMIATGKPGAYTISAVVGVVKDGRLTLSIVNKQVKIGSVTPPPPPPPPSVKPDPRAALGRLTVGTSGCTVTVIGPRRPDGRWDLLSASHCLPGRLTKGSVKMPDGRVLAVTLAAREPGSDLAWFVTDESHAALPFAVLAARVPEVGTKIWHAGYGVDRPGNVEEGVVLAGESRERQISMDLSVSSGDSGGGIFRKDTGELVAAVCCTRAIGRRATMFGGSSVRAIELRPSAKTTEGSGHEGCAKPVRDLTADPW